MGNLGFLDYAIIITYLLFALGTGIYFSKRASKSSENYFLGGRSLPWWMISISMIATSFASDTPLVVTEITRKDGLQRIWWVFVAVLTLIVGIFLFSRLWRRAAIITDAEFYELRYEGKSAAFLRGFRAFFAGIIQNLIIISYVIFAMSSIITTMTDIPKWWAVGICTAVALVYATFSGFYGVVVTDFIQFFIATFSMIALAVIAVVKVGGLGYVLDTITANENYGPKTLSIFPDFRSFNLDLVKLLILIFVFWWMDANGYNMQRMSACKNERHSVLATLFYAIFQCCRPWIWVVVALVSIVLFPTLTEPYNDTHAYPLVMNEYLGYGLKGLLVTAFLAAFMSTVDTHLNWGASYIMTDIYQRFIKKDATQRHYMIVTKIAVVLLMAVGVCIALYIAWRQLTVSAVWEFFAFLIVPPGMINVARWFWWRINAYTEITALSLGVILGIANFSILKNIVLFGYLWSDVPFEIKIAIITAIVVPISIIVTFLTPAVSKQKLEEFYRKVRPGGFWGILGSDIRELPGKALSVSTIIDVIGGIMLCYGISLAIGYSILLKFTKAGICCLLAAIGGFIVFRWYQKEVKILAQNGSFTNNRENKTQEQ
ncbi:MAG: Na+:solute symporter [Sedimentisphaerales bacterium]|nr:Na+:solute symporter [Sedimentisphaerales bacterium]